MPFWRRLIGLIILVILWCVGFAAFIFFGFVMAELGSTKAPYGDIATTIFGLSIFALLVALSLREHRKTK